MMARRQVDECKRLAVLGVLLAAGLLSGCSELLTESPIASAERSCLAEHARFIDAWGCIQAQYEGGKFGERDARLAAFMKYGDDLAGQVASKTMTDSDAKKRLADGPL